MSGRIQILFDHGIFCRQTYGGSSKYYVSLARELSTMNGVHVLLQGLFHHNDYLARSRVPKCSWVVPAFRGENVLLPKLNGAIYRTIPLDSYDIVHETYPISRRGGALFPNTVVTMHDMIHEKFPELFPASRMASTKRAVAARAKIVMTISENSRKDIIDIYDIDPNKVKVAHLGVDLDNMRSDVMEMLPSGRPFFAFVGRRDKYKDFPVVLRAVADSGSKLLDFDIVAFGGGPPSLKELEEVSALGLDMRVHFFSGTDQRLAETYRGATAFIFPSRYEGFGLPLLEAMAARCPLICSNASCFPEIAGDAAWYFEAGSSEALAHSIVELVSSPTETKRRVENGLLRASHFSWKRCAMETLDVYRSMIE